MNFKKQCCDTFFLHVTLNEYIRRKHNQFSKNSAKDIFRPFPLDNCNKKFKKRQLHKNIQNFIKVLPYWHPHISSLITDIPIFSNLIPPFFN